VATYRNYIGGEWVESQSGRSIPNTNPANLSQSFGDVPLSTEAEMKAAIASAHEAFKTWRRVPAPKRADIVFKAWRIMGERKEEIGRLLSQEEGKILPESLGEVQKTLNILEFQAGEGRRLSGYSRESELPRNYAYTRREPLGAVGLITPWNFPVCIPAWKIAPAIIAGNTVVLKPSELTPATAVEVVKCFVDAGAPRGVINLVHGLGAEVGELLVNAPEIEAVSFTGSNDVGHHIYASAAKRGVRVQCEMGGKNPIIVMEDANLPLAIAATATGAFGSTGQRCTATSRAIVHESIADEFVAGVLGELQKIKPGCPLTEGTTMGPSVSEAQLSKVLEYMEIGKGEAELKAGGYRYTEGDCANGVFPAPTLFDHVSPNARIATEEIFGPVLCVIRVKSFDEAMEVANNVQYGLSSSIYTNNYEYVMRYAEEVETGICHINSPTMGGEAHMPFGGMKSTGIGGREMNEEAMEFFTEIKTVYFDYTGAGREGNLY
jgi:aldehyde dehydrogenase (NAD+)